MIFCSTMKNCNILQAADWSINIHVLPNLSKYYLNGGNQSHTRGFFSFCFITFICEYHWFKVLRLTVCIL